ncbi:mannose-1-phosphate guanylyltransferase [Merismopedia glauca]|uniref:Mannose-1-phosphate guanylyltransferase n=1 Tax=Merismopedia glauca CCAP 1448/3 TaxID=1296344 RepID=A0A2T1C003_9CYAN|nr:mannose-1-phosphate guanylyltransferase [Merismopedia glauca]PSB01453.1 mannose-1-phosphate guanylyltransferase [Merismopedia glauca CCAP 1448/3]
MNQPFVPVILAGGKGERFWPLSRKDKPKQFLCLDGSGKSLLQATAERLLPLCNGWSGVWVVTSVQLAAQVKNQLPQLPESNLLLEPEGKDTAPAVTWATIEIAKRYGEEAVIGFFPADHWIGDETGFQQTLQAASEFAATHAAIVTLGIAPGYPAVGYGYIQQGEAVATSGNNLPIYKVERFREKPDRDTATEFLETKTVDGNCPYTWNSGMFIFRTQVVLEELAIHASEILQPLQAQGVAAYPSLAKKSIDYALMEKTQLAYVLPANFGWDDLGDWNALERLFQGETVNVELAQHVNLDTTGAILYASDDQDVIVTIGLEDVIVVRDRHVTLIVKKDRTQEIKQVLKTLQDDPQYRELL